MTKIVRELAFVLIASLGLHATESEADETKRIRITEYADRKGKSVSRMLYDHSDDPGEKVNVAENEARNKAVTELTKQLHQRMGRDSK